MSEPLFRTIEDEVEDDSGPQVSEMESLCLNCREDGITKMLFTRIPFFREVVIMSFECPHCHWKNNELQPASRIQEKGVRYSLKCKSIKDLSRQVVKTEWAEIIVPEVDFEVRKQNGLITTIEGLIDRAVEALRETIPKLDTSEPETIIKMAQFVKTFDDLKEMSTPFTFIIDDPTGNSYVESYLAPDPDPEMEVTYYTRTLQQNKLIGIVADDAEESPYPELNEDPKNLMSGEVLEFPTNCHSCNAPCFTNMKLTEIPHFKSIIIMATNCDACGHKTREVKSGSGIGEKGVRIKVKMQSNEQLNYEVVRSDTCSILVPEIELELHSSGSGRYTTMEGLIGHMKEELHRASPFIGGDSAAPGAQAKLDETIRTLDNIMGYTIVLDDPCGNSYVEKADESVWYERTYDQNEELGVNDMKTENY
ncbi:Zinc finger protein ZPR1 [Halotydeus destructor]|nr:Zinc finger protein ZPR1 [Halotydeus destructor]